MTTEISIIVGFATAVAFLTYLGHRFGRDDDGEGLIKPLLEGICYSFAGLMVTIMLFLLGEITSAATYYPVIRTVFIIFQIIVGLLSGLGAVTFSIILIVLGLNKMMKGVFGR